MLYTYFIYLHYNKTLLTCFKENITRPLLRNFKKEICILGIKPFKHSHIVVGMYENKIFIFDFLEILKRTLQNYKNIGDKYS